MPAFMERADQLLEAARRGGKRLTHREVHALAGLWYQRLLGVWQRDPTTHSQWDGWRETVDLEDVKLDRGFADELLADEGVVTGPASRDELAKLMAARLWQALDRHDRLLDGDYRPDLRPRRFPAWEPAEANAESQDQAGVSLNSLLERWQTVATVKPRSASDAAYIVKLLVDFLGHDDATRLTRGDLQRWRDGMKADGLTNTTWNNRLSHVRQPIVFGVREGLLPADVTEGLRLAKAKGRPVLPFTDAEAVTILHAARKELRASVRWAPWLMAFSGMRVGEVLQLTGGDVRNEGEIWFLSVNEEDPSKSVKTSTDRNVR